jgi:mono/diheme cytochrome c family protein
VRAIREGKSRNGRILGPPMPYELYRALSDRDVGAMVAYLRTVAPVRNASAPSRYTIPLPTSYGRHVKSVPHPGDRDLVAYGAYLAGPVAHCIECHSPRDARGAIDRLRLNAGGFRFPGPPAVVHAANITPDRDTGIGTWTDAQIVQAINGTTPSGRVLMPPMPWPYYVGKIRPHDLQAIVAYLRSVRPVRNAVPRPAAASAPAAPASR